MLHTVAERWSTSPSQPSTAKRPRFVVAIGTRPEAIKLAPVVAELRTRAARAGQPNPVFVCATGQHDDAVRDALALFAITVDRNLALLTPGQSLGTLSARILSGFEALLTELQPEWVLVQGDTATTAMAGLAAFYAGVKVAHIEAGLRTHDLANPFPEECNRRMVAIFASMHFAATPAARANLLREGVPPASIVVTGNTGIDALLHNATRLNLPIQTGDGTEDGSEDISENRANRAPRAPRAFDDSRPIRVLITVHRRENQPHGIENVCLALNDLARNHPGRYHFVWPLHPNPAIGDQARRFLDRTAGVTLTPPATYDRLLQLLNGCDLVLTDSGGIQEEAPSFAKPVLVLRDATERPEGIDAGIAWLTGNDPTRIVAWIERLTGWIEAGRIPSTPNPYGDGHAATRIADYFAGIPVQQFAQTTQQTDSGTRIPPRTAAGTHQQAN